MENKDTKILYRSLMFAIMWVFIAAFMIGGVTFAWFTSNQKVDTFTVEATAVSKDVRLDIAASEGELGQHVEELEIPQEGNADLEQLMPVSTYDLSTFVYNKAMSYDKTKEMNGASIFAEDSEGKYYYHGKLYMRGYADGEDENTRMALYLTANPLEDDNDNGMSTALRLGFTFNQENPKIFSLSEASADKQINNTMVDGTILDEGNVLSWTGSGVSAESDPSELIKDYIVDLTTNQLPEKPIAYLDVNKVYEVDVYYYIEGCDPDCSGSIAMTGCDVQLAFYGVLSHEQN